MTTDARRMSLVATLSAARRSSFNQAAALPRFNEEPSSSSGHAVQHNTELLGVPKKPGRNGAVEMIRNLDPGSAYPQIIDHSGYGSSSQSSIEVRGYEPKLPTVESSVTHFREFHQAIPHPASVLNLVADEQDRDVYTAFDELCNELLSALGDFESSLEEITIWKDDFLTQTVPSSVKLQMVLLFSRLFRSKSEIHEPLFELIKQVRLYSRPWTNKRYALLELEKDYHRQTHVLDVSIRKLEQLQGQLSRYRSDRRVGMWERLARKMLSVLVDEDDEDISDVKDKSFESSSKHVDSHLLEPGSRSMSVMMDSAPPISRAQSKISENVPRRNPSIVHDKPERRSSRRRNTSKHSRRTTGNSALGHEEEDPLQEKAEIREYIAQPDPMWVKKAKTLVEKFEGLLTRAFPKHRTQMVRIHMRPFPKPFNLSYVSKKTGTLNLKRPSYPNMPRSWSLIDIQKLRPNEQQHRKQLKSILTSVNSSNAINELAYSELKAQPGHQTEDVQLEKFDIRRIINADSQSEYSNDGYSADEDENDDDFSEFEYFNDIDQEALESTIGKFVDSQKSELGLPLDENALLESKKGWFSLQDVMELTLLHAQQMQLLQSEYEDRISELEARASEAKKQHDELETDYEVKLKQAHERAQRIARECMRTASEAPAGAAEPANTEMSFDESFIDEEREASIPKRKKSKRRSGKGSKGYAHVIPQNTTHIRRKEYAVNRKPKFTSAPFTMSFLERLRWFTEEKLKNKTHIREKFMAIEIAANEEKLQQLKLIKSGSGEKSALDAEFLPFPGHVPAPRHRPPWAEHVMPWGGRFHSSQEPSHVKSVNPLNLFEVAVHMNSSLSKTAQ